MRMWDIHAANGVDYSIANLRFIEKRLKKIYERETEVIYPSVDIDALEYCEEKEALLFSKERYNECAGYYPNISS